jgi:hypothetical protein
MSDSHGGGGKGGLPFLSVAEGIMHSTHGNAVHITAKSLIFAFVIVLVLFFLFAPEQSINNFQLLIFFAPIWAPWILIYATVARFIQMNRAKFFASQQYVLLEIRIPREITKTPQAMELFFANLHIGSGETNWYKKYFQGSVRPWWSLEIVSLGGRVHFYIWTRAGYRRLVESFLYAQYPDAEIIEAEDYTRMIDPSEHGYSMFAAEYKYSKPDPYPIKTYIDYKMEPGNKPEENVDPIAQIIETLGSIGPGEQFWVQMIIRQTKGEKFVGKTNAAGKPYSFADFVQQEIDTLKLKTARITKRTDPVTGAVTETEGFPNPTKGQTDLIAAMDRKNSKQVFDVGIRSIYSGTSAAFNGIMIPAQLTLFKPYNSETGNALGPAPTLGAMFSDLPWEDRSGHHHHAVNHLAVQAYRRRSFYFDPYVGNWVIMSTEELASLFHLPSSSVSTPNLPRVQSTTSSAPSNLPS